MPPSLSFWDYFVKSHEKQNQNQWRTHCMGCVKHRLGQAGIEAEDIDMEFVLGFKSSRLEAACNAAGNICGKKSAWIAHILGGKKA
ncbi:unnamed protein product, partial [Mycena citricolor]